MWYTYSIYFSQVLSLNAYQKRRIADILWLRSHFVKLILRHTVVYIMHLFRLFTSCFTYVRPNGPLARMTFQYILWPFFAIECNLTGASRNLEWYDCLNTQIPWLRELEGFGGENSIYSYSSHKLWPGSAKVHHKKSSYMAGPTGILLTTYLINS